jgi:protein-tyrosine phosphatase
MSERSLRLTGAPNARDLGGLVTSDGRQIRTGRLVRSGGLGRLTDADLPVLATFGFACRIDLRHDSELTWAPPDRLPEPAPRVLRLPLYDQAYVAFTQVASILSGAGVDDLAGDTALAVLDEGGARAAMRDLYRWFVNGAGARALYATAVRAVADPANLPTLFHCSAGKDRTGWLAVVLLTALGVDPAVIREDYLRTNTDNEGFQRLLLDLLARRLPPAELTAIRPMLAARPEYLDEAYAEVERVYGSFDGYLRRGLGLDDRVLTSLRTHLLV